MCSSACKRARPGTPCHCDCRRRNHGIYYGRSAYHRPYSRPAIRVAPREYVRPLINRRERTLQIPRPHRAWGRHIVMTAVIGVSCAALPGACPAIVALGKAVDLYVAASEIVGRARQNRGMAGAVTHSLSGYLASEAMAHVAGPWSRLVSDGIASRIATRGLDQAAVRMIVSSTVSEVMSEGTAGLALWAVRGES